MLINFFKSLKRNRSEIIFIVFSIFLFFVLRLYNLKLLPIFVDEAIYIRWAQQGLYDASQRLISLSDGKQPLFIWLITFLMNFIPNPLAAGKLVSIGAGFATMVGLFLLCLTLFKDKRIAITAAVLYVFYPFALLINRMAIYESLVGMFYVWSLYGSVMLVRFTNLGVSLSLGLILGGGMLTKSSGLISIYLLPVSLLFLDFTRKKIEKLFLWFFFALIAVLLANLCYSILSLSDKLYMISQKNGIFTYHINELIKYRAFETLPKNIIELFNWTLMYLTYPLGFLLVLSFFGKEYRREKLFLYFCFFIPIIGVALFSRVFSPRYIFPLTLSLLPILAISFKEIHVFIKNKISRGLFIALCIGFLIYSNYKILTDLSHAPIPREDTEQYANGFSSGEGFREIVPFLQEQAKKGKIIIASEGTFGSLPGTVIEIYFAHNTQVERYKFEALPKRFPDELLEKAKTRHVFVIFNETQSVPSNWALTLLMQFKRGGGNRYLSLYKIQQ